MAINLPPTSSLVKQTKLKYGDLRNESILSPQKIGFWQKIYQEQIPNVQLIYQEGPIEYNKLLNYSTLLFFTTNLTKLDPNWGTNLPANRFIRPLTDKIAHQQFYICFLKQNRKRLAPLIRQLQD